MTGARRPEVDIDPGGLETAPVDLLDRAVRKVLEAEGASIDVSVALLDDRGIRDLNLRFLGKDAPTDVIAFGLGEGDDLIGDVYLGWEQATRQAAELGIPLHEELARLAIHGTLHVLGHDHPDGAEREVSDMFRLQERLLGDLLGRAAGG